MISYLSEIERREVYVALGYPSLFAFCTKALGYSKAAAVRRINAARALNNNPEIARMLLDRELSLTTVSMASKQLRENAQELLALIKRRSTREVERILAKLSPQIAAGRDRVRQIAFLKPMDSLRNRHEGAVEGEVPAELQVEEKLQYEFTACREFGEKVEYMKELLSGKLPRGASLEQLFGAALDDYIEKHCPKQRLRRRRERVAGKKAKAKPKMKCRLGFDNAGLEETVSGIPPQLRDEILARDGYKCTFKHPLGHSCDSLWDLEVDHIIPRALGGTNDPKNLRTLCSVHNFFEAQRVYGKEFMEEKISGGG